MARLIRFAVQYSFCVAGVMALQMFGLWLFVAASEAHHIRKIEIPSTLLMKFMPKMALTFGAFWAAFRWKA